MAMSTTRTTIFRPRVQRMTVTRRVLSITLAVRQGPAGATGAAGATGPAGADGEDLTLRQVLSDSVSSTFYVGVAASGAATSASVWTIRRTTLTNAGAISTHLTATNVKWDDRLTATYS